MSGFEIAGITLAAWPILIEGLKFYAEERGVIKDFCNCQPLIQSIFRQLKREKVTFENSAKCLLNAAAQQSDRSFEDTKQMMCAPEDPRWDEEIGNCEGIFSQQTANLYTDTRKDLENILGTIQACLNKVPPKDPNKRTTRHQWQRLLLAIRQDQIDIQLDKAETLNRFLINLTRENVLSTNLERESIVRSAKHYKTIRKHANHMAEALQSKLLGKQCLCQLTHNASLVLEVRRDRRRIKDNYFRVLFGFDASTHPLPWSSREMEIQACEIVPTEFDGNLDDSTPTIIVEATPTAPAIIAVSHGRDQSPSPELSPKTKHKKRFQNLFRSLSNSSTGSTLPTSKENDSTMTISLTPQVSLTTNQVHGVTFEIIPTPTPQTRGPEIQNLCDAISASQDMPSWSGILSSERNILQQIRIASKSPFVLDSNARIVSLAELLSTGLWNSKAKSRLGLKLASTVLQLYETPWLGENWGKQDVLFVQQGNGQVLIDSPFLKPRFALPRLENEQVRVGGTFNMHVPTLFALGVVLLELHHGKSIVQLQMEGGLDPSMADEPEIFHARRTLLIMRLIGEMNAGDTFEGAIKQCIKGPDGALTDLNRQELCDMVEEKIILPLERQMLWAHACQKIEDCV